jgi:hypothetical protein
MIFFRNFNRHLIHLSIHILIHVLKGFIYLHVRFVRMKKFSIRIKLYILVHYTELTFDFNHNSTTLFDDEQTFKSICKLEWTLRTRFTSCSVSTNDACCQHIGPGKKNKIILYMFLL